MCSFLVSTTSKIEEKDFKEGLQKINHRGPDMTKIIFEDGIWGFNRLSIMGLE